MANPVTIPTKRKRASKHETHMYYRKPNGWIIVGGVKGGKKDVFEEQRGFTPLKQFGELQDNHTNEWEHILTHPDGPVAFPLEQVMAFRWYNPDDIPKSCDWEDDEEEPCPVMLKLMSEPVVFPQLSGHKVTELSCPECDKPPFSVVDGVGGIQPLARHLSIMHDWDMDKLKKYGDAVDIDFDMAWSNAKRSKEFDFAVRADFSCECGWKPDEDKDASPQKQLAGHNMGAHKEPVTA